MAHSDCERAHFDETVRIACGNVRMSSGSW